MLRGSCVNLSIGQYISPWICTVKHSDKP